MNLRQIATPLTIGGFILMAVTGVLMFFHKEIGFNKPAHEWFSWAFLTGAALHIYLNFGTFKKYFRPSFGLGIIVILLGVLGASFVMKGEKKGASPVRTLISKVEDAPISTLAILVKTDSATIIKNLNDNGFKAQNETQSLSDIVGKDREAKEHALGAIFGGKEEK
ncbi:MAG: DUF4405 domain-containing protein [Caulobacterales bacterium]|nr:DUF4405 domain-containing protein [Caulobacterales bacterium]